MGDANEPTVQPKIDVLLEGDMLGTAIDAVALCSVLLIEGPNAEGRTTRILVDPAHVGRRVALWGALAKRGLTPQDIDAVVLTHAHWDHVQNVDVFKHAPLYLHPEEYQYSLKPHEQDWATPSWTGAIFEGLEIRDASEGIELIPGVGIVDMPGHSIGSIGITVENADGLSVVTGDAIHYAGVALASKSPLVFWDSAQAKQSIERVVDLGDVLYPGHDQPFRITKAGEIEFVYGRDLTLNVRATSEDPGVHFKPPPWGRTDKPEFEPANLGYADPALERERDAFAEFLRAEHLQRHEALEVGIINETQADHRDDAGKHHAEPDHDHGPGEQHDHEH